MTAAGVDGWVENWLSPSRFAVYLQVADGHRRQAVALYEWNAMVSSAFHHDLAHLEVGLRNAYDRALCRGQAPGEPHWVFQPMKHFPVRTQRAANGARFDANEVSRVQIVEAIRKATPKAKLGTGRASGPAAGKVIAELSFGFWRYLSVRAHHDPLWIPYLRTAFRQGTDRRDVDRRIERLHRLRNRVAHHEPLLGIDLQQRCEDLERLADLLDPQFAAYIAVNSSCARLLATRPCVS